MNEKTILIVDDEEGIRQLLETILQRSGYRVLQADNGEMAIQVFQSEQKTIDLVLIDVMMSPMDGFELCAKLRPLTSVPLVMLTAVSQEEVESKAFTAGADDFVTKPIKPSALLARLERRIQLPQGKIAEQNWVVQNLVVYDEITIDTKMHRVTVKGEDLALTSTEYSLLLYFMSNPKKVMSRQELLDEVWGTDYVGTLRTVDVHTARLRLKLGNSASLIQTERGFGYIFGG